jgi:hypothetical protein
MLGVCWGVLVVSIQLVCVDTGTLLLRRLWRRHAASQHSQDVVA